MLSIFAKRRKQQPLDRRRSLAGVPVVNKKIAIDDSEGEDRLVISMTLPERRGLIGRLLPTAGTKRIRLDELGSFVLRQIDGKRTAKDIIDAFVERYKTNRRETELSVVEFLKGMLQREVIVILVD